MIGLCGAHRTGKSTLGKAVAKDLNVGLMEHNEAGKILASMNLSLDHVWSLEDRFEFQTRLLDAFEKSLQEVSEDGHTFVTDRTPLDIAAYLFCEVQKAGGVMTALDTKFQDFLKRAYAITNKYYSMVVHVPVAIPYVVEKGKPLPIISYQKQHGFITTGMLMADEITIGAYFMSDKVLSISDRLQFIRECYNMSLAEIKSNHTSH